MNTSKFSKQIEPVEVIKSRRDRLLRHLVARMPYINFLGMRVERHGDELTFVLPFGETNIGNPVIPALHGGAIAGFLESAAIIDLSFKMLWDQVENGKIMPEEILGDTLPLGPKTIDFSIDYLRPGLPRDAYARAKVVRKGRRFATVHVEAWQDNHQKLFSQATGHFLVQPS